VTGLLDRRAVAGVALALVAVLFCGPIADGDFFWHLGTGRWIAQHHALPDRDPFTYTAMLGVTGDRLPLGAAFTLKSYWLAQLAIYGLWQMGGAPAIVALRALVYLSILIFSYAWMRRLGRGWLALAIVIGQGLVLAEYSNERPQLFTFLLLPVVLALLDRLLAAPSVRRERLCLLLPPLLLLWANLHGGFVIGLVAIGLAMAAHLGEVALRRTRLAPAKLALLAVSATVSGLNPMGFAAIRLVMDSGSEVTGGLVEYLPPHVALQKLDIYLPSYWAFLAVAGLVVVANLRRGRLFPLAVLTVFVALSLTALRYTPLPLLAAPLLVPYVGDSDFRRKVALCVVFAVLVIARPGWKDLLQFRVGSQFPTVAAPRICASPGRLFCHYDWGGYLAYACPGRPVFIDGRNLSPRASTLYDAIVNGPDGLELLDAFAIGSVAMPLRSEWTKEVYRLTETLWASPAWVATYSDAQATLWERR
jgi:hypothetical protein